jgi:hypothetical protein
LALIQDREEIDAGDALLGNDRDRTKLSAVFAPFGFMSSQALTSRAPDLL